MFASQLNMPDAEAPAVVADVIERLIESIRLKDPSPQTIEETSINLGSLWGEQVVQAADWRWGYRPDGAIALVSPDDAHAVLPIHDVDALLSDRKRVSSLTLLFNTIVGGALPPAEETTQVIRGWYEVASVVANGEEDEDYPMPPPPPPPPTA